MNPIKKLAGQTVIYGLSSIIGRILNYLLVPLYTRVFSQGEYGVVNVMYAYVAIAFILLTYGMETTYFRYSEIEKSKKSVYNTILSSIFVSTFIFLILTIGFASGIARLIEYPDHSEYVVLFALILAFDAITAIPFAKLRAQNRPIKFASIKFINISVNIGLNLFFLLLCPYLLKVSNNSISNIVLIFFKPGWSLIVYVFISNLVASAITLVLLYSEFKNFNFHFDFKLWKKMIIYALPLLLTGLAGIMNETYGRLLMKYILPENIAEQQIGIYSASIKIAFLLNLFVQAFRYAAEPFFFSHEKEKDSRVVYARIMNYFVIATTFIFLGIMLYIDIVVLIIGERFREGIAVIPILLMGYLFLGIFYNLSIWYKLTNKTRYGAYMALGGALITIVFNLLWIPRYGYMGSAWAAILCYGSMMVVSYIIGMKHYAINYQIGKIIAYISLSIVLVIINHFIQKGDLIINFLKSTILLIVFISVVYFTERNDFRSFFIQK